MKRIAVNFRLEAELLELLKTTAKQKAISKTAMLEECLRSTLHGSISANGEQDTNEKATSVIPDDIQALVNTSVEQKINAYLQKIEKEIAQLQNELAILRQASPVTQP